MKRFMSLLGRCLIAGAMLGLGSVHAEQAEPSSLSVLASQRVWFASLEGNALDAQVVVPQGTQVPVLRTSLGQFNSSDTLAITTVGIRYERFGAFVSVMPTVTTAVGPALAGGSLRRKERDVGVTYQLTPSLAASLVWKWGQFSPLASPAANTLLRARGEQTGSGLLLGVSGSASLADRLSLYGSFGYGPARWRNTGVFGGEVKNKGRYTVAESGLAYRLLGPGDAKFLSSVSVQAGFRMQIAAIEDVEFPTLRLDGTPVSVERGDVRPITSGWVMSVSAAF